MVDATLVDFVGKVGLPAVLSLYCLSVLNKTIGEQTKVCQSLEAKLDLLINELCRTARTGAR